MSYQRIKPFLYFFILSVLIAYGSLIPGDQTEKMQLINFIHSDKLIHAILYFLLTISLVYGMVKVTGTFLYRNVYLVVLICPVIYGLLMEILQKVITTDRSAEPADLMANLTGIGIALLSAFIYHSVKNMENK